jgi:hypothetical protein
MFLGLITETGDSGRLLAFFPFIGTAIMMPSSERHMRIYSA